MNRVNVDFYNLISDSKPTCEHELLLLTRITVGGGDVHKLINSLLLSTSREDFEGELKMKFNCLMFYFLFYIATIWFLWQA